MLHTVFLDNETQSGEFKCGVTEENSFDLKNLRKIRQDEIRQVDGLAYLKMSVIIPYSTYSHSLYGKNDTQHIIMWVFQMFHELLYHFQDVMIVPVLMYLEIWTNDIEFPMAALPLTNGQLLSIVSNHRINNLRPKNESYDATHMFLTFGQEGVIGLASVGAVCDNTHASSWSLCGNTNRLLSGVCSHELGHVLGLNHDDDTCFCAEGKACLLTATYGGRNYLDEEFSNCSKNELSRILGNPNLCLYRKIESEPFNEFCGNRIVSSGEECDCGSEQQCIKSGLINCCNFTTCKFLQGKKCCGGICCNNGRLLKGNICRQSVGECYEDVRCDGRSSECTKIDYFKPFGSSCGSRGRCLEDKCITRDMECQELWSTSSREADRKCLEINRRGTIDGNCGVDKLNNSVYSVCAPKNIECGKLFCTNILESGQKPYNRVIVDEICGVATQTKGIVNIGLVPDFAACGRDNEVCYENECIKENIASKKYNMLRCGKESEIRTKGECFCENTYIKGKNEKCFKEERSAIAKLIIAVLVTLTPIYANILLAIAAILGKCNISNK